MAPRSDPLRPAGHPQSTDSIQTQPGLLHPSQLSPSMHSVSSTPTPPADPPPLCTLPPLHASGWDFPRARGQGSVCGWRAGEEHFPALETKRKTERGTERCRLIITAVLPPEKEVARTWPSATQGRRGARTPRALLPFPHCGALRCHEASIRGEELCPPAPQKPPAWGCSPRLPPDRNDPGGTVETQQGWARWGGGWQRWDLTAAPGPSRKALPQEQRRRQGRDAPLPTLHLAAGDVSHRQKCWVERKDAAPLTQLSRQPIPPARIAACQGWGGREAGCARALACCCRASLGAQHPVVLQGPTACTPYGAGKGFSPHLHGWTLQGCRSSGTAGCAEQLNHTSPCSDTLERRGGDDQPWDRAVGHQPSALHHQPWVAALPWAWGGPPLLPAASAPLPASRWATGEGG
ncbi:uncharacterized protein LOC121107749 isoform X3 [Gallus gallus]|uniref:uncharacterized protein LOC121107749 isoform X3 n=1 Tax=Gallus gallus TaxID=9031 RepID=UPI001AE9F276|nr:uncharacterized protein LOC121107749 isoform X3 [Gallus gallus]